MMYWSPFMDGSSIFGKVRDSREDGVQKTTVINLGMHVVYYYICPVLSDGFIRKLDIIYHGI